MSELRIGFIGWGSMAEAMIKGLLRTGLAKPENILATGTRNERGKELAARYGIATSTDNASALNDVNAVVLAVKPQVAPCVLDALQVPADVLVISIMAGISIEELKARLQTDNIIRCMPNTPGKIGMGYTGWTAAEGISMGDREIARSILGSLGKEQYFSKEELLHVVTAAAASAVAFVCKFVLALIEAAVGGGISRRDAKAMILQVVKGTVALIDESDAHPAIIKDEVTSPGGTTIEGDRKLEEGRFTFTVIEAVRAAHEKSVKLGNKK